MNPRVGYPCFPIEQMLILLLQAREYTAFESVTLYIIYTAFYLSLVTWRIRFCGQNHSAVMFAKGLDFGMNIRIVPVGILYGGLEIVDDQSPGHAAEMPEGIFQTADEVVGGLTSFLAKSKSSPGSNCPKYGNRRVGCV